MEKAGFSTPRACACQRGGAGAAPGWRGPGRPSCGRCFSRSGVFSRPFNVVGTGDVETLNQWPGPCATCRCAAAAELHLVFWRRFAAVFCNGFAVVVRFAGATYWNWRGWIWAGSARICGDKPAYSVDCRAIMHTLPRFHARFHVEKCRMSSLTLSHVGRSLLLCCLLWRMRRCINFFPLSYSVACHRRCPSFEHASSVTTRIGIVRLPCLIA